MPSVAPLRHVAAFVRNRWPESSEYAFVSISLGPKDEHIFSAFDLLRNKRNKFIYEPDLPCSHTEAKEALEIAGQFVEVLTEVLDSKNGQGRLGFNEKKRK
jgi:hypothetical protein